MIVFDITQNKEYNGCKHLFGGSNMDNNIFDFATSELSQDAVICWCINWFNFKDSSLYPLAKDTLNLSVKVLPKEEQGKL